MDYYSEQECLFIEKYSYPNIPYDMESINMFVSELDILLNICVYHDVLCTNYIRLRNLLSHINDIDYRYYQYIVNHMSELIKNYPYLIGYDRDYSYLGPLLCYIAKQVNNSMGFRNFWYLTSMLPELYDNRDTFNNWIDIIRMNEHINNNINNIMYDTSSTYNDILCSLDALELNNDRELCNLFNEMIIS